MSRRGTMHNVSVAALEFVEGGNTLWVHSPKGGTVLRIKATGRVRAKRCSGPLAHVDVVVEGDIEVCLPKTVRHASHK